MKRALPFSDSEYGEEGSPDQSCDGTARKKRRGIVEKRRRDRINQSLIELKRLVPAAYEKQGSAKLEKAEILQMTVDHLKTLNEKSIYNNSSSSDPERDRGIGFRECANETARYLVSVEGMDLQNPLRLRLLSHLERVCMQRENARNNTQQWANYNCQYMPNASQIFDHSMSNMHVNVTNNNNNNNNMSNGVGGGNSSKQPYRPWGTELAY